MPCGNRHCPWSQLWPNNSRCVSWFPQPTPPSAGFFVSGTGRSRAGFGAYGHGLPFVRLVTGTPEILKWVNAGRMPICPHGLQSVPANIHDTQQLK